MLIAQDCLQLCSEPLSGRVQASLDRGERNLEQSTDLFVRVVGAINRTVTRRPWAGNKARASRTPARSSPSRVSSSGSASVSRVSLTASSEVGGASARLSQCVHCRKTIWRNQFGNAAGSFSRARRRNASMVASCTRSRAR